MSPSCPLRCPRRVPVRTSRTDTIPEEKATATQLLSGLTVTERIRPGNGEKKKTEYKKRQIFTKAGIFFFITKIFVFIIAKKVLKHLIILIITE